MADDQTIIEKMAKEIEELKSWIAANEERDYRHLFARAIRRRLPDHTITSIVGPMVLTCEMREEDEPISMWNMPACRICNGTINYGDMLIEAISHSNLGTSFTAGHNYNPRYLFHESCIKKAIHDSSDERLFEEWIANPRTSLIWP
jgi:hypothetical protein